jgi:predicted nucleic acid-binding protein
MPQEKTNGFIDSNIWLYAFLQQQDVDKTSKSKELLHNKQLNSIVSTQIINEVCFNLRKKANFSESDLMILIDNFYHNYSVINLEKTTLHLASELRQQYKLSFWDSLVIASALQANANVIYTEDMQNDLIIHKTLKIINPFLN